MEKKTRSGSKQKPNKKKRKKYIIISIVFVLLAVISAVVGGFYAELSKINTTKLTKDNSELGISDEAQKKIEQEDPNNEITNIALFGVDRRSDRKSVV